MEGGWSLFLGLQPLPWPHSTGHPNYRVCNICRRIQKAGKGTKSTQFCIKWSSHPRLLWCPTANMQRPLSHCELGLICNGIRNIPHPPNTESCQFTAAARTLTRRRSAHRIVNYPVAVGYPPSCIGAWSFCCGGGGAHEMAHVNLESHLLVIGFAGLPPCCPCLPPSSRASAMPPPPACFPHIPLPPPRSPPRYLLPSRKSLAPKGSPRGAHSSRYVRSGA